VVYAGYGADPVLTQVADPDCPADGVVVAAAATGVCRSDWQARYLSSARAGLPGHLSSW
jgi:D-arabinose 1-dehydrogenase-like Zn-dependent alcohol dehydrogenase